MRELEIIIAALVFALVHWFSPQFASRIRNKRAFSSFSGGLASAYVFLHLIPELSEGHALLGERIYMVALLGFTLLYAMRTYLERRTGPSAEAGRYGVHITTAAVYSMLLVFTLALKMPETPILTGVFILSLALHLLGGDVSAHGEFGDRLRGNGRYILIGAVLAGLALGFVRRPNEWVVDTVTALLAGFMLFSVFREELPDLGKAHFRAFLFGLLVFTVLHVALADAGGG